MQINALGYVGVEATEPQAWADFGPNVLGLPISPESSDDSVLLRADQRSYRLAVHPGQTNRLAYVGWEVPTHAALEAAYRELDEAGVEPRRGSAEECEARHVRGLLHCMDPAGNAVEIFYGQRTVCETFRPARPITGFVTGDLGLGHVVFSVPNLETAQVFYRDVLGLRISDLFLNRLVFFHCNPRHYSLAIGQLGNPGLSHIMLEVQTIDDVGMTYDLCREKGSRFHGRWAATATTGCFPFTWRARQASTSSTAGMGAWWTITPGRCSRSIGRVFGDTSR